MKRDILIPEALLDEILKERVTIFAGAGISTESKNVAPYTLYEDMRRQLNSNDYPSFPKLVTRFHQDIHNGEREFIIKLKDRFDYIDSFPELQRAATGFHRELASIYYIKNIVTTNWDTYFEDFCAATPFVKQEDTAFWDVPSRRVLKIHGSITSFASLVSSEEQYEKCESELSTGQIGAFLKTLLTTDTIIFIGYSFKDSDFVSIYKEVSKQLSVFKKSAYVVTPFEEEAEWFKSHGLVPIITDGTYFLELVKAHFIENSFLLTDDIYEVAGDALYEVEKAHEAFIDEIDLKTYPHAVYSLLYQDGLMHAFERAIQLRKSGEYNNEQQVHSTFVKYSELAENFEKKNEFTEAAYCMGYSNALLLLLENSELKIPPLYFSFDWPKEMFTLKEFKKSLKAKVFVNRKARGLAKEIVSKKINGEIDVVHRSPW
jgi:NAD-dependent SIR2 family protein deacetylase